MKFGDKEMLSDMLHTEKALAVAYTNAELETANGPLRATLIEMQKQVQENHAKIFHEMHQRGWYQTETASQQAIESTIISWEQKFCKEPELSLNEQR